MTTDADKDLRISFYSGGCSGTFEYGDFNSSGTACINLMPNQNWDTVLVTQTGGMQTQLYVDADCSTCAGCNVYNQVHEGSQECVTSVGSSSGLNFIKSLRVVQNGTAPGACTVAD